MKRVLFLTFLLSIVNYQLSIAVADETVTVTAMSSDISENLDLKTVATLFGQAKDLEQFEQMLNNPDSAFSNLDLNGDGEVDYLRVIETADGNRHLVVIQAVLAKDIYQDVASIFVEKDDNDQITVQVVGDEYIYGANYIIEPVYIYRPYIYDWFWGPSWVCWHSPYYWGYWPGWWRPYYCVDPFIYWDHCYWHHYHYPICSYRTGHHHHAHYRPMYDRVSRNDLATRHPERSFATRNASRNISNARSLEQGRRTAVRDASTVRGTASRTATPSTRINTTSQRGTQATINRTYGSSNVRSASANATTRGNAARTSTTATRTQSTTKRVTTPTRTQSSTQRVATPTRTQSSTQRVATPTRTQSSTQRVATPSRTQSSAVRSSSAPMRSSSSAVRSSSMGTSTRSSGMSSGTRSGSMSSGSRSGGGSRR